MIEYDVNVREYCNIVSSLSPNDCGTVTVRISHPCGIDGESWNNICGVLYDQEIVLFLRIRGKLEKFDLLSLEIIRNFIIVKK